MNKTFEKIYENFLENKAFLARTPQKYWYAMYRPGHSTLLVGHPNGNVLLDGPNNIGFRGFLMRYGIFDGTKV